MSSVYSDCAHHTHVGVDVWICSTSAQRERVVQGRVVFHVLHFVCTECNVLLV